MILGKYVLAVCALATLSACGGAGHVGQSGANRGASVANEGNYNEVITRVAASSFITIEGQPTKVSTTGTAEVLYKNRAVGQRVQVANRTADAEARARAVSGCTTAVTDHVQNSFQGTHVIVGLAGCPPIAGQDSIISRLTK